MELEVGRVHTSHTHTPVTARRGARAGAAQDLSDKNDSPHARAPTHIAQWPRARHINKVLYLALGARSRARARVFNLERRECRHLGQVSGLGTVPGSLSPHSRAASRARHATGTQRTEGLDADTRTHQMKNSKKRLELHKCVWRVRSLLRAHSPVTRHESPCLSTEVQVSSAP